MTNSGRSRRVFLAHGEEEKGAVRALYERLKRDSIDVWFDEEDLVPGQDWQLETKKAVRNAWAVVVCVSSSAMNRPGYFHKVVSLALDVADEQPEGSIFVIPARLEDCEIPERLRRFHWVNLYRDDGYAKLLRALGRRDALIPAEVGAAIQVRPATEQVRPLFISYSHGDTTFVEVLEGELDAKGIRYWRDQHDMVAGRLERQIDRAITLNPTVLLVLSSNSVSSDWVEWEASKARELERRLGHDVLCPIALDDAWRSCDWPGPLRRQIEDYHILDFSQWADRATLQQQVAKLIDGLKLFYNPSLKQEPSRDSPSRPSDQSHRSTGSDGVMAASGLEEGETAEVMIGGLIQQEKGLPTPRGECRLTFRVHPCRAGSLVQLTDPSEKRWLHALFERRGVDIWENEIRVTRDRFVLSEGGRFMGPRHDMYITETGSVMASLLERLPESWSGSGYHPIALSDLKTAMGKVFLATGDVLHERGYRHNVAVSVYINPEDVKTFLVSYMSELDEGPRDVRFLGDERRNLDRGHWKTDEPVLVAQYCHATELSDERIDALIDSVVDQVCLEFGHAGELDVVREGRRTGRSKRPLFACFRCPHA